MAPFIPVIAGYFEARAGEGLSRQDREALRLDAYRAALLAVNAWIQENVPKEIPREDLGKIFTSETEGQRTGREWYERGSRKVNGEWVSTEPEEGAERACVWNSKNKQWQPPYPPPLIMGGEPSGASAARREGNA
jgi:hypothetical protein